VQYHNHANKTAQETVDAVFAEIDLVLEYQAQGLASTMQVILDDPALPSALLAKDKNLLSEKWLSTFDKLREEHSATAVCIKAQRSSKTPKFRNIHQPTFRTKIY